MGFARSMGGAPHPSEGHESAKPTFEPDTPIGTRGHLTVIKETQ
jgi:hypothetical protein